jgi:EAL domain-containing protein (putative c-di-GMP-specific phosphodiesterase class I)
MPAAILYPALEQYLAHLGEAPSTTTRVWADAEGHAQGKYFNATLTSVFQPIRDLASGQVVGHEGFVRSHSRSDQGLCVWKLLDRAANDDESVELDRLCRMLHSINFFRQPAALGGDLYLSVHQRLLAAVGSNHGDAFRRVLGSLGLPRERVVLQLPAADGHPAWLVKYVADNYRGNGFRLAVKVNEASQGLALLQSVRPEAVKVDARVLLQDRDAARLVAECGRLGSRLIVKRVENAQMFELLQVLAALDGEPMLAQGFHWDQPQALLHAPGIAARNPAGESSFHRRRDQAAEVTGLGR